MPCPYFEPRHVNAQSEHATARLPLIDEYDGLCQARDEPFEVPGELRFRCCNHGNSRGTCSHFPDRETRSSIRYEMVKQTSTTLDLILLEERDYAPAAWRAVRYALASECLDPEVEDACQRAQIRAFCRSFLDRFPAGRFPA
jgi:hypothetical protein